MNNQEENVIFFFSMGDGGGGGEALQVHFVNAWTEGCHIKLWLCRVQGTQKGSLEHRSTLFSLQQVTLIQIIDAPNP